MEMTVRNQKISLRTVWGWERKANRAIIVKSAAAARRSDMSDNSTAKKKGRKETKLIQMPRTNKLSMYVACYHGQILNKLLVAWKSKEIMY